ncbi:hypothetical protein GS4_03_01020 [Gordonia soli NBRC 108243]|uniref:Uncharacterized protein n=1 Tax=Gordonia soli NBRC 108243 TaxID=1223545 RepID=M0QDY3_9ACTN|nr:hypothetical protein GS4_03_01020 [Gordonia soli NBRC 108243]
MANRLSKSDVISTAGTTVGRGVPARPYRRDLRRACEVAASYGMVRGRNTVGSTKNGGLSSSLDDLGSAVTQAW